MAEFEQWVNLRKEPPAAADLPLKPRRGELPVEVTVARDVPCSYLVKLQPLGDSDTLYTDKELGRNGSFARTWLLNGFHVPGTPLTHRHSFQLPAAGGLGYRVVATYFHAGEPSGVTIESDDIVFTRRRLFFQVIVMEGCTAVDVSGTQDELWSPGKNFFIRLEEKGRTGGGAPKSMRKELFADETMDYFLRLAKQAYVLEDYEPNAFAVLFVDRITQRLEKEIIETRNVPDLRKGLSLRGIPVNEDLWYMIDGSHRRWLENASCTLSQPPLADVTFPLTALHVGLDDGPLGQERAYRKIRVDLSGAELRARARSALAEAGRNPDVFRTGAATVRIEVTVAYIDWYAGFQLTSANCVLVGHRIHWDYRVPDEEKKRCVTHEVGHIIGMVATSDQRLPDGPSTRYGRTTRLERGHLGPHCQTGMTWTPPAGGQPGTWSVSPGKSAPGCIMFGALGHNGAYSSSAFCGACSPVVRKLSIQDLPPLKKSLSNY